MATRPKETDGSGDEGKKPKSKLVLFIIIGVIVLAVAGFAATKLMGGSSKPKSDDHAEAAEVEEGPAKLPVYLTIEPFVVNLQPENGDFYLQVSMTLQLPTQKTADTLKLYMPQVRSRLLMLLSSKKSSELITSDGKEKLRDDIIDELSEPFSGNRGLIITDVAYTSFVIQQQ
jgi:flagellar FliL protein